MDSKLYKFITWLPRILSLSVFIFLLTLFFILEEPLTNLIGKIILLVWFVTISVIAWKNEAIGGALYVLLGAMSLIVVMGLQLSLLYILAVAAAFVTGTIFIIDHLYREKEELREESDF